VKVLDDIAQRKTALTIEEVADILQTTKRQVKRMIADGELPSIRVGNAVRFDPEVFSEWLRKTTTTPKFESLASRKARLGKARTP
jgi:excisionase family DNA binding protein